MNTDFLPKTPTYLFHPMIEKLLYALVNKNFHDANVMMKQIVKAKLETKQLVIALSLAKLNKQSVLSGFKTIKRELEQREPASSVRWMLRDMDIE